MLARSGLGSRRRIVALIKRGGIAINGEIVQSFNEPVDPAKDVITIDGEAVSIAAQPMVYVMLNKPRGVISSTSGRKGEKTVLDLLPQKYHRIRLYPVGRLDKDSTGLILLTNDGDLTLHLTHPRFEHEKEYLVRVEQDLAPEEIRALQRGIDLEDGKTSPAEVKALKHPLGCYSLTIHEGKKREVRRMFAALGYRVIELKRVRLGSLRLGTLPEGEIRELTLAEVQALRRVRTT